MAFLTVLGFLNLIIHGSCYTVRLEILGEVNDKVKS